MLFLGVALLSKFLLLWRGISTFHPGQRRECVRIRAGIIFCWKSDYFFLWNSLKPVSNRGWSFPVDWLFENNWWCDYQTYVVVSLVYIFADSSSSKKVYKFLREKSDFSMEGETNPQMEENWSCNFCGAEMKSAELMRIHKLWKHPLSTIAAERQKDTETETNGVVKL